MPDTTRMQLETTADLDTDGMFQVVEIDGTEEIGTLYRFRVMLNLVDATSGLSQSDIEKLVAGTCTLRFGGRAVHGVVSQITMLPRPLRAPPRYNLVLVPRLWLATLTRRSRVFRKARAPAVVASVLRELGLKDDTDFTIDLSSSIYGSKGVDPGAGERPRPDLILQYEETDFQLIRRLMGQWGFTFTIRQDADREHVVLTDNPGRGTGAPTVLDYDPRSDAGVEFGGVVTSMSRRHRVLPGHVRLDELAWREAQEVSQVTASAGVAPDSTWSTQPLRPVTRPGVSFQQGDFPCRHPVVDKDVEDFAGIRAQAEAVRGLELRGRTKDPSLSPGTTVTLRPAPSASPERQDLVGQYLEDLTGTGSYAGYGMLITRIRHRVGEPGRGDRPGLYRGDVRAIPAAAQYRPRRATGRRISGVLQGKIDGTAGVKAPIDKDGAYEVRFPFDLAAGQKTSPASAPVRMAQPNSGPGNAGFHLPLHVGSEVAVGFINGHPDRPVILGALPNATTPTPVTAEEATRGRIQSVRGIQIELEDEA